MSGDLTERISAAQPTSPPAASSISLPLSAPTVPAAADVASPDASSPLATKILTTLAAKGIPTHDIYLPYMLNAGTTPSLTDGHIHLTYTSSPAPYGIGEFGLNNESGVITPYVLSTPSVEANFSTAHLSGYSPDLSSPDEWGVQLNAVLNNVTILGTKGDQFWTQNVFSYSPSLGAIEFVSNIWNLSNPTAYLSCNSFYEAGGYCVPGVYYYDYTSLIPVSPAFQVQLYLNSTLIGGRDAVFFNYSVTSTLGTTSGELDYAIFNSLAPGANPASTVTPAYEANGFQYNPFGLPDDFEVILGGPGGGSNFDVFESEATYMSLAYWNASEHEYLTVPSAYNVGGDTGETSFGVNAAWSQFLTSASPFPVACVECVTLSNGPSFQYGLWGVGGAGVNGYSPPTETSWAGQSRPFLVLHPPNGFLFMAEGSPFTTWTTTNWSRFQWVPDFNTSYYYNALPIGSYTVIVVAAEYEPYLTEFTITSNADYFTLDVGVAADLDRTTGVYTPLWALNATGLANITSGYDAYGYSILDNNQYAPMGQLPATSSAGYLGEAAYFPWFGVFNDYGFQVFPGILLWNVSHVDVFSAPSFSVAAPTGPSYQHTLQYLGLPQTNNLQMFFWDDIFVRLESSTVTGWFPAVSDFGPSQSFANVVFWNTSDAYIAYNTFSTGGMGLFLYGGYDNEIFSNYFLTGATPQSTNPYSTAAAYFGSIGLVDADWGDAALYGSVGADLCDFCDIIYNNVFDTVITATQLATDPYTGAAPALVPYMFSEAWNIPETAGTNILGGNYLGGNYWWDYGYADNPFGVLPDREISWLPYYEFGAPPAFICGSVSSLCQYGGGDYDPLVDVALYNITFEEHGLPSGVDWDVSVYVPPYYDFQGFYATNTTVAPKSLNFTETPGTWSYYPYSYDPYFGAVDGTVTVTDRSVVVVVQFLTAYVLNVRETGLPSGTYWWAETYSSAVSYAYNLTDSTENSISGLIAGTYTWWAFVENSTTAPYAGLPYGATVTISANATVTVHFAPIYTVHVNAVGLPSGAYWSFTMTSVAGYNYSYLTSGAWLNITTASTTYAWTAAFGGYVARPGSGSLDLAANTTLTVTFQQAASLTFTETGLPTGTAWTVAVTQGTTTTTLGGTGSSISFPTVVGPYSYAVGASAYAATPASGEGTLTANTTLAVTFALATGTLGGTVSPSGATLWVDGTQQTLGSGGSYSLTLPVGMQSIEVTDSGYVTYFNNVTVALGKTTTLNITLTSVPSTSSGVAGISTTGWALIGVLAALVVIFAILAAVLARRRGRQPPPVAPYTPSGTAPSGGAGGGPPWQEPPPPPSGSA